jgi:histidinol dehydrogenase
MASRHHDASRRLTMKAAVKRSTVHFDSDLHRALRVKAAHSQRTLSDIVNDAVRRALQEDAEDLAAFEERGREKELSYDALLKALKAHGKI